MYEQDITEFGNPQSIINLEMGSNYDIAGQFTSDGYRVSIGQNYDTNDLRIIISSMGEETDTILSSFTYYGNGVSKFVQLDDVDTNSVWDN